MTGHRLFVALALPRPARDALRAAMGGVAGARWQDDDQLHCTVRFLGEIDGGTAFDVADMLGTIRHAPIAASFGEAGSFDRAGATDTLWIGVSPLEAMRAIHAKVDRALVRAGITADRRAYLPHVTIARFGRRAAPPVAVAASIEAPRHTFLFDEMRLYESRLGAGGASYEVIEAYPLR